MSELLSCPFCGGEAEMLTAESMNGGYLFGIMCNDCRSRGDVYDTEAEAIAAWNSRADEAWPITEITTDHIDLEHGRVKQRFIPERTCTMSTDKSKVGNDELESLVCSECGHETFKQYTFGDEGEFIAYPAPNYCPNCGAKVRNE